LYDSSQLTTPPSVALSKMTLPSEEIRFSIIEVCSFVHTSSNDFGEMFLLQLQRVYTTPKSYLDLIYLELSGIYRAKVGTYYS
jgi:hypothetical protein